MIRIATDGSCIGNPGPGAYAIVIQAENGRIHECAFPSKQTTVGEMEVRALLLALTHVGTHCSSDDVVLIQADSQYVVNGFNEWMAGWKAKGWSKKGGLAHADLWKQMDAAKSAITAKVTVEWVRAHQNNGSLNDRVDSLANNSARSQTTVNPSFSASAPTSAPALTLTNNQPAAPAEPSMADLAKLLSESRDMIDHLARSSDTGAHELSRKIGDTLARL